MKWRYFLKIIKKLAKNKTHKAIANKMLFEIDAFDKCYKRVNYDDRRKIN